MWQQRQVLSVCIWFQDLRQFVPRVTCPYAPTPLTRWAISRFLCNFFPKWPWLFFQNVIQVKLHGGKIPNVLYWEMKLQADLHVSSEHAAATSQQFNWSGPPLLDHETFSRTDLGTWISFAASFAPRTVLEKVSWSRRGDLTSWTVAL